MYRTSNGRMSLKPVFCSNGKKMGFVNKQYDKES